MSFGTTRVCDRHARRMGYTGEVRHNATDEQRLLAPGDTEMTVAPLEDAVSGSNDHAVITLDVSAGSKKDSFPSGYNSWRSAVLCQVSAPAVGGKANRTIVNLVAETFGVRKSAVRILSGTTSTIKKLEISGLSRVQAIKILKDCISV
ncbi:MAG: uncharacterized protein PWP08_1602 [Methanofollis sp.]|nr:uncharacterized protein [Methanofollis sp.]